ncbi:hypothetical protein B0G62_108116 [Paraburkholderia eburnea]|uniref:Uncharacterized protein n=1 Tax=Paraburkholderia eburnea TaxID=1189126 RepID=A0A2S4M7D3_9BURK|nr:hypothetical protein B0G62_108116 [Paraburkholderia eburnea]PRZ21392.1 hypothetical protein BX588_109116 [Paraburkholderia eburnea]
MGNRSRNGMDVRLCMVSARSLGGRTAASLTGVHEHARCQCRYQCHCQHGQLRAARCRTNYSYNYWFETGMRSLDQPTKWRVSRYLDSTSPWNSREPVREEQFGEARLAQHAKNLASAQSVFSGARQPVSGHAVRVKGQRAPSDAGVVGGKHNPERCFSMLFLSCRAQGWNWAQHDLGIALSNSRWFSRRAGDR